MLQIQLKVINLLIHRVLGIRWILHKVNIHLLWIYLTRATYFSLTVNFGTKWILCTSFVEYICIKWIFEDFPQTSQYLVEYCTIRIHIMRGPNSKKFILHYFFEKHVCIKLWRWLEKFPIRCEMDCWNTVSQIFFYPNCSYVYSKQIQLWQQCSIVWWYDKKQWCLQR